MKLSEAIEMLARCAQGNEDLAALADTAGASEHRARYRGAAEGFRRAIDILKLVDELDPPAAEAKAEPVARGSVMLKMNGRKVYVDDEMELTYEAVAILALGDRYTSGMLYTITCRHGDFGFGLSPGEKLEAHQGMVINVAYTGNS